MAKITQVRQLVCSPKDLTKDALEAFLEGLHENQVVDVQIRDNQRESTQITFTADLYSHGGL